MANVSRPLIALLVGTVAFFALWLVALKPSPSSPGGASGLGRYQSAINAAHSVAATTKAGAARAVTGTTTPSATSTPAATATPAAATTPAVATTSAATTTPAAATPPATRVRLNAVQRALKSHKVIALLFFNPAAADDVAVKHELAAIPTRHGRVVKLSVPLTELSHYTTVTDQVQVDYSPTLVLIDRHAQATTIVGFADTFEIANRIDDTLAAH
jgi:hypothetical protein